MIQQRADNVKGEWLAAKISFVLVSVPVTCIMALVGPRCPFPTGICRFYDFAPFFGVYGAVGMITLFVVLSVFYVLEKQMLLTTFFLALLSMIIIAHHESNGVFYRATVLSVIWIAQFGAYLVQFLKPDFNLSKYRIQFSVQAIAAVYMLAGISKLKTSGIEWINAGDTFPLQVIKNYSFLYFDSGLEAVRQKGESIAYFMLHYPDLVRTFLGLSLALELFCLLAALNNRIRFVFGVGLLFMHLGIASIMGIGISIIAKPMIVFFINPLYIFFRIMSYFKTRIRTGIVI